MGAERPGGELVQGTLDMLILRTLARGASHGWGIAQHIRRVSDEVLGVKEGSLDPALHRLELGGDLAAEWGVSKNNRRARIYKLTARGRRPLESELERWDMLLFEIAPTDPVSFALVPLLLLAAGLAAALGPARRGARVDPVAALRWE